MAGLRLIVGLGNPGAEHLGTRHNAGFWFADALAQRQSSRFGIDAKLHAETTRIEIGGESLFLFKPITYMNKSGAAVAAALRYYKIEPEQMLIAHDDLDLPAGAVRLKFDGGHGGQNGLRDVFTHLGHGRFHRLRFGIGHPGHKDRVLSWVLGRPGRQDHQA
ncbi:MAG: aminoacyl-tRNA hydrolase, partial [Dokdonella sp.]